MDDLNDFSGLIKHQTWDKDNNPGISIWACLESEQALEEYLCDNMRLD